MNVTRGAGGIGHVLACVDRSVLSESCVPYALFLSKTFGARMTLLHVLEPRSAPSGMAASDALGWEIARHEVQAYLDRIREAVSSAGVPATTRMTEGHPAASIVATGREIGADVTVLGTHGEGGGRAGCALGSTAAQVLASSRGSVLVARSTSSIPGEFAPKTVLVPLDGSTRAECVLPSAVRIAKAHQSMLLLVHVVMEPVATAILTAGEDLEHARGLARRLEVNAERYLGQLQTRLSVELPSVRALVIRATDERRALTELSVRENVDLIIVSAHGSTANTARSLGTVSNYLVSLAHPALLVLQDLPQLAVTVESEEEADHYAPPLRGTIHAGPTGVP